MHDKGHTGLIYWSFWKNMLFIVVIRGENKKINGNRMEMKSRTGTVNGYSPDEGN